MAKSSGGGGRAGRLSRPQLASGFSYGRSISATPKSLSVGDRIRVNTPRLSASGQITKINRTTVEVSAPYFNQTVNYKMKISELSGGFVQRGNKVFPVR